MNAAAYRAHAKRRTHQGREERARKHYRGDPCRGGEELRAWRRGFYVGHFLAVVLLHPEVEVSLHLPPLPRFDHPWERWACNRGFRAGQECAAHDQELRLAGR